MPEIVSQPYLVSTLVNLPDRRPDWSTYPVPGIHLEPVSQTIYAATFNLDGSVVPKPEDALPGNARHNGLLLPHDKRTKTHRPHVPQFNRQAVSLLTTREAGYIAALLGIEPGDSLGVLEELALVDEQQLEGLRGDQDIATSLVVAHCLGANMLVGGLADGQSLQRGHDVGGLGQGIDPKTGKPRPEFRGAVGITGTNQPCPQPGALLAKVYGLNSPKVVAEAFEDGARNKRGHIAQIIESGVLRAGDPLFIAPYRS